MDLDLVARARTGDTDAFAALVHQCSDRLFAVAYRILRDTELAEDALQNALLAAWRQLPGLREVERFEAWSYRILVHACYAEVGRRRRFVESVRRIPSGDLTASDASAALADRDELERIFQRLPVDQRAVFVLHHYLGWPLTEIAGALGVPAGTARSRLHYATRALRAAVLADRAVPVPEDRTA